MSPIIQNRYKLYKQVLLGKITLDEYLDVFDIKNNNICKYSGTFVENNEWWIANISKLKIAEHKENNIYCNTLYMHKYKDTAILKTFLITYNLNKGYMINNIFIRMLRSLGYYKVNFENKVNDYETWGTRKVKILITKDKTDIDLINLIQAIEKYNYFVKNSDVEVWSDYKSTLETIKNLIIKSEVI